MNRIEKWYGGVLAAFLLIFTVVSYYEIRNPITASYLGNFDVATTDSLENSSQVVVADHAVVAADLFSQRKLSDEKQISLQTWNRLDYLNSNAHELPNGDQAIHGAGVAWNDLMASVKEQQNSARAKEKLCPHFLEKMNASELDDNGVKKLRVPCGLTEGSSITFTGVPNGLVSFQIDLIGEPDPGKLVGPVILHYNVRLNGDKLTVEPVILQNTWTSTHGWGDEERCPSLMKENNTTAVDELDYCNELVGKDKNRSHANLSTDPMLHGAKPRTYFPFKQNDLFVATLGVGSKVFQMTVDGEHITSFTFCQNLEPWLVNEVRISGGIDLVSVVAKSLPTLKDLALTANLDDLKAMPLPPKKHLDLFIGVFSSANYFRRRMAVRRSWMQYPAIRSGKVAARFFVGLHKNQMVNEELWTEARTYRDIQLMPFVDYYDLISWKTIAICIFGTDVISAKFIMKTDDDSFVRVDEILNSLGRTNVTRGLLYGYTNFVAHPERNPNAKWYTSSEEWPEEKFPKYAYGPGYVVSNDIAKAVSRKHRKGLLKVFKLEDVSMGSWIQGLKDEGLEVRYENNEMIIFYGCKDGYVVAHYQAPGQLLCLWKSIQETNRIECCD